MLLLKYKIKKKRFIQLNLHVEFKLYVEFYSITDIFIDTFTYAFDSFNLIFK